MPTIKISKPSRWQLYRHYGADGRLLYVGISIAAWDRQNGHRSSAHWWQDIERIEVENYPTELAVKNAEALAVIYEKPLHNIIYNDKRTLLYSHWRVKLAHVIWRDGVVNLSPAYLARKHADLFSGSIGSGHWLKQLRLNEDSLDTLLKAFTDNPIQA